MDEIIDLENFNTYPIKLVSLVKKYLPELTRIYVNSFAYGCEKAFEKDTTFKHIYIFELIEDILDQYEFIGYHITRIVNIEDILNDGLRLPERSEYLSRIKSVYQKYSNYNCAEIEKRLRSLEYNLSNEDRQKTISLFVPMSKNILYEKDNTGYLDLYGRSVGGELATLNGFSCPVLQSIGSINVIKFILPFSALNKSGEYPKDYVIKQIIMFTVQHILSHSLDLDALLCAQVTVSIPKDKILNIYNKKEIDKFYGIKN